MATIDTGTADVLFERRGAVGWVTFNRPESRNAMTFAMYEAIVRVCDAAEADPTLAVLVFRGAGEKAFVAGTDIGQFRTFTDPQHAIEYEERMDRVIGRLVAEFEHVHAAFRVSGRLGQHFAQLRVLHVMGAGVRREHAAGDQRLHRAQIQFLVATQRAFEG